MTDRIGYWVDLDRAYITYTDDYIESVWWLLKSMWDKKLLYQGHKVVPYCPRCGTPLSDHEVALGYEDTEDPSIYVRFPWWTKKIPACWSGQQRRGRCQATWRWLLILMWNMLW